MPRHWAVPAFRWMLRMVVRGKNYLHFQDAAEAEAALREAGFERGIAHRPVSFEEHVLVPGRNPAGHAIRVVEATC